MPEAWTAPEIKGSGRTVATPNYARALELYASGLEVVLCIDTTGSMQSMIDAAARSVDDIVVLMQAIAPDFRLGLVEYNETGGTRPGASIRSKLTDDARRVRNSLKSIKANGGGDFPERVELGLELALHETRMAWRPQTTKLVLLIGDAPPHDEDVDGHRARCEARLHG